MFKSHTPKGKGEDPLYMENIRFLEEKIKNDPQTFQETCQIYHNIQNLTEISLVF